MALKAKNQTGNMIKMTTIIHADKAARNFYGTNEKASCWGHPKSGPPRLLKSFKTQFQRFYALGWVHQT